jgi:hypothetical protein
LILAAGDQKKVSTVNRQINQTGRQQRLTESELNDRIRYRAYELFEQSGRADGHELDDWMQAESEVLGSGGKVQAA